MSQKEAALMALVRGVVSLSESTREMASTGEPDDLQLASMKAKTAQIAAALKELEPSDPIAVTCGDMPEPMATSASSAPTLEVSSLDDLFD
jgi:hypothetical protein